MTASETTRDGVVEQIEIDALPDRVFAALITPRELARWWGDSEMYRTTWDVDLSVGGEYVCHATAVDGTAMEVRGRFVEIDRPRRLAYTWNASWDPSGETMVAYDLIARGEKTLVRVTQSGFATDADLGGYKDGWTRVLGWLSEWVEQGIASG